MYGEELEYVKEAYEINWMSTVGANINVVEKLTCEKIGSKYAVALPVGTAALHLAMKLTGIKVYGIPKVGYGALEGKKVFCSGMTFAATNKIETLILGAFGCGIFVQNPTKVAEMMKNSLRQKYPFKKVIFAIPKSKHNKNYEAFKKVFE